jgi:hypothetical protein
MPGSLVLRCNSWNRLKRKVKTGVPLGEKSLQCEGRVRSWQVESLQDLGGRSDFTNCSMHSLNRSVGSKPAAQASRLSPPQRIVTAQSVFGSSSPRNPPDAPKEIIQEGREWIETILSRFGPIRNRAQTVTTLDFEKPLLELDKRITEVGCSHASLGVALNFSLVSRCARLLTTMAWTSLLRSQS